MESAELHRILLDRIEKQGAGPARFQCIASPVADALGSAFGGVLSIAELPQQVNN